MDKVTEVLQNSTVEGNLLRLPPGQLDRKDYEQVKKKLEGIGGKWKGGKISAFVFNGDPNELLQRILGGENVNLKKDFQFFPTPDDLADELVQLANVTPLAKVLEPSAGRGAIIKAIQRIIPGKVVGYCELMPENLKILESMDNVVKVGENFLDHKPGEVYDLIIANPPFAKNQDIDHIRHMYNCLKPGGSLVTIASIHWKHSQNTKEIHFRNWLKQLRARVSDIDPGEFKESGTMIPTCIIMIVKPKE
jgi:SAM-dependent methyltransferase